MFSFHAVFLFLRRLTLLFNATKQEKKKIDNSFVIITHQNPAKKNETNCIKGTVTIQRPDCVTLEKQLIMINRF